LFPLWWYRFKQGYAKTNILKEVTMDVMLEYFDDKEWVHAGGPFGSEHMGWVSLGGDDHNYRTVDMRSGEVLTDKSEPFQTSDDAEKRGFTPAGFKIVCACGEDRKFYFNSRGYDIMPCSNCKANGMTNTK
jgi:hypothetical protein